MFKPNVKELVEKRDFEGLIKALYGGTLIFVEKLHVVDVNAAGNGLIGRLWREV
ncbi:MAG: hypothetical protein N2V77_04325 [Canidatus Methanoxibalbensis ujae]|nr:hypothetical protein [Candidatus Methanoxibalbensis ujae]